MRFENEISPRPPDEHPIIIEAYKKAHTILERDAFDPEDFVAHYGREQVDRDAQTVARLKERFSEDKETRHTAEVLEAIIYEHGELSDWFGSNTETIKTSEFDDIINGIDLIVEYNLDDLSSHHLALAVDVTFGMASAEKKMARIQEEIDNDELAKVKYFESHGFTGALKQVPRVVVGVECDTVKNLAALWNNKKNTELGNHETRYVLLEEIHSQLETFLRYSETQKKERATQSYRRTLKIIGTILKKRDVPGTIEGKRDRVFTNISNLLSRFH